MSAFRVPEGLMQRLHFVDEPVEDDEIPPRIDPATPLIFSPGDD